MIETNHFQAAIRGLLDIMSGNNTGGDSGSVVSAGSSAYDTNSVCTTADASVEPGGYACTDSVEAQMIFSSLNSKSVLT